MSELIKIYEAVVRHEEEAINMEKRITEEVEKITKPYEKTLSTDELEELQDILFDVTLTAEHEGFLLGVKYFAKLLAECWS